MDGRDGVMLRVAAGLLALAASVPLPFAAWLAVLNVLVAAQRPNPRIEDGDPCCAHPDTWGEVVLGFGYAAVALIGCAGLLFLACVLALFALSRTPLNRPQARDLGLAAAVVLSCAGLLLLS